MKSLLHWVLGFVVAFTLAIPATVDAGAQVEFEYPRKLDQVSVTARAVPIGTLNPTVQDVEFFVFNDFGIVFNQSFAAGVFDVHSKENRWKYKVKRNDTPQVFSATIIEKYNKKLLATEYLVKFKAEADAAVADPIRNVGPTEDELGLMTAQASVGGYNFFLQALWDRIPKNPDKPVKAGELPTSTWLETRAAGEAG